MLGASVDYQFPVLQFTSESATAPKETDTDPVRLAFSQFQNIPSVDIPFASPMVNETIDLISSLVAEAPSPRLVDSG